MNLSKKRGREIPVCSVVTQVVVDKNDPAFENLTKPIRKFYSEEEAKKIEAEKGYTFKEDAGRGYRRVVASPKPVEIVENESIRALYEAHTVTIAGGGGGVPVIKNEDGSLEAYQQ